MLTVEVIKLSADWQQRLERRRLDGEIEHDQISPGCSEKRRHCHNFANCYFRSLTRITSFKPDQTSLIAQTLTSTTPAASAMSRITFSVRSVGTPDVFFGQLTQIIPAGARAVMSFGS